TLKAAKGASGVYDLTLTNAKEIVTIAALGEDSGATIKSFATGADKIDLATIGSSLKAAQVTAVNAITEKSGGTTLDTTKVTVITSDNNTVVKDKITISDGNNTKLLSKTVTKDIDYLIAVKASDSSKTAIYHAKSTNDTTLASDEIKLVATVEADLTADTSWLA
ncbi:MAG: hypothetical protein MSC50_04445, partial [Campylobacter sp.]|uniref:hypothetical protein n=1 Tax=Campylobacter sp. TaxID=205 RepID=UPI002AA864A1